MAQNDEQRKNKIQNQTVTRIDSTVPANKSCKELAQTIEGKSYLYWNRCMTCQRNRRCPLM